MISTIESEAGEVWTSQGRSAVSWGAIFAGTFVIAAVTLVLFAIGAGFGLATVPPWPAGGRGAAAFALVGGIWLIVVQWIASGLGGYLTGRLRTRWVGTHGHEVFFRDTAHGLLAWSLAAVLGAGVLAAALGGAGRAGGSGEGEASPTQVLVAYDADALFRSTAPGDATARAEARDEAERILTRDLAAGGLPDADRTYLAQLVAARTGVSAEEAQVRVQAAVEREAEAARAAKKAAAATAVFGGLSMLVGAFIACVAAALGGQQRDLHP